MSITIRDLGDFEGKYGIEEAQALRILGEVTDLEGFEDDWENGDYWLTHSDYLAYLTKVED